MRITHVTWGHYPQWKGCGPVIYLHYLALEQRKAGHDVTIVCASDRAIEGAPAYATATEVVEGIPYVHLCNRPVLMHDFWNQQGVQRISETYHFLANVGLLGSALMLLAVPRPWATGLDAWPAVGNALGGLVHRPIRRPASAG